MNVNDTRTILQLRRELTGENFNDGTIAAWSETLDQWPTPRIRQAIIDASKTHTRINIAHIIERLPKTTRRTHDPEPPNEHCAHCDGTGWTEARTITRGQYQGKPCTYTTVTPCHCTTPPTTHDLASSRLPYRDE